MRNAGLASGRKGTMGFMLLLRISRRNGFVSNWEKVEALTARHVIWIHPLRKILAPNYYVRYETPVTAWNIKMCIR